MHLMDCKGVAAIVYGGILHHFIRDGRFGASQTVRLMAAQDYLSAWYERHPGTHRLPRIRKTNLTDSSGWANLNGPTIKAANTRAAAPAFEALTHQFFNGVSERDACLRQVVSMLAEFYDLLYASPVFLSNETLARLTHVVQTFGASFQRLRALARHQGQSAWKVTPKVHKMQHLPMLSGIINPCWVQCYAEESLVGTTTRVWKRSVAGR